MRKMILNTIAKLLILFTVSALPAYSEDGKWQRIFDGKSLSGWTPKIKGHKSGENYNNLFRVEDGALKVSYENLGDFNEDFGHIFYNEELSHYRIRFDYRFTGEQAKGGPGWAMRNSGIMLHGQHPDTMGLNQKFPVSDQKSVV